MARTPARLGTLTAHTVGFEVSAAGLGAATHPVAIGLFAAGMGVGVVAPAVAGRAVAFLFLHERLAYDPGRLAGVGKLRLAGPAAKLAPAPAPRAPSKA